VSRLAPAIAIILLLAGLAAIIGIGWGYNAHHPYAATAVVLFLIVIGVVLDAI